MIKLVLSAIPYIDGVFYASCKKLPKQSVMRWRYWHSARKLFTSPNSIIACLWLKQDIKSDSVYLSSTD